MSAYVLAQLGPANAAVWVAIASDQVGGIRGGTKSTVDLAAHFGFRAADEGERVLVLPGCTVKVSGRIQLIELQDSARAVPSLLREELSGRGIVGLLPLPGSTDVFAYLLDPSRLLTEA